jgi:stage IV sporulation protein FB
MFGQVNQTQYDLRFQMFGIPIRVHPAFWLVGAIMGGSLFNAPNGIMLLLIWIGCLFVSILVHELGHALVAKYFGWPPQIVLYHFGGLASYQPTWGHTSQRSILISFAGPGAGFILYGLVRAFRYWLVQAQPFPVNFPIAFAILQLEYINLYWGLINLLPVLPLDGGHICEEICKLMRLRDWMDISLKISMVVAGAAAFYFFSQQDRYPGFLFGYLCFNNFQTWQAMRGGGRGGPW